MTEAQVRETLRRVFEVVMREVERNPTLARNIAQAIAGGPTVEPQSLEPSPRKPFDALQLHAINILRQHGEAALRGRLEQVKAVEDLKSVAKTSGLVLSGDACKTRPSRAELITAIVAAAKHYDAQRNAAIA